MATNEKEEGKSAADNFPILCRKFSLLLFSVGRHQLQLQPLQTSLHTDHTLNAFSSANREPPTSSAVLRRYVHLFKTCFPCVSAFVGGVNDGPSVSEVGMFVLSCYVHLKETSKFKFNTHWCKGRYYVHFKRNGALCLEVMHSIANNYSTFHCLSIQAGLYSQYHVPQRPDT